MKPPTTGARQTTTILTEGLNSSFSIDYGAITKTEPLKTNWFWRFLARLKPPLSYDAGEFYDWQELLGFWFMLTVSPLLVFLSFAVRAAHGLNP
jgi:hypothetical protein